MARSNWGRTWGETAGSGRINLPYIIENYGSAGQLAGMVGFEPTVHCTKNSCLTTWLHPISVGLSTAKAGAVHGGGEALAWGIGWGSYHVASGNEEYESSETVSKESIETGQFFHLFPEVTEIKGGD